MDWFWGTMGTELSILTGNPACLLEVCSPGELNMSDSVQMHLEAA